MRALVTWPTYGTWLNVRSHRRIQACQGEHWTLPEPDAEMSIGRRRAMKRTAVYLDDVQCNVVRRDLERIALIRQFLIEHSLISSDHVHLLLQTDQWLANTAEAADDAHVLRLVQLIKGATSRALSVSVGDRPPIDVEGNELPHRKWWTRQHVVQVLSDAHAVNTARIRLEAHDRSLI